MVERFGERFEVIPVSALITEQAVELLRRYRLNHELLIADALLTATAITKGIPLASKSQKDYRFIEELTLWPYPMEGLA